MVKSKDLKLMRKKLEKADKIENPLELIDNANTTTNNCPPTTISVIQGGDTSGPINTLKLSLSHHTSLSLASTTTANTTTSATITTTTTNTLQTQCLNLFEDNMGELYRSSAWGLDMDVKQDEFQHKKARFLIVTAAAPEAKDEPHNVAINEPPPIGAAAADTVVAFAHFRFCYDDEDDPQATVVYVYEIQVAERVRRLSVGRQLMGIIERMAVAVVLPKVMLTVFQRNTTAMQFYREKLGYVIDGCSPSQHNQVTDYEILSKSMS